MPAWLGVGGAVSCFCSDKEGGDMQQCRAGGEGSLFLALSNPMASSGHIYSMTFARRREAESRPFSCPTSL